MFNASVLSGTFISKLMSLILSYELVSQLSSREECGKGISYKTEKFCGTGGKKCERSRGLNLGGSHKPFSGWGDWRPGEAGIVIKSKD